MTVNCKNILKLPACKGLKLLAGKGGQNRIVKWVYYLEDPGYIDYLKGGELVITTGLLLKEDTEAYIELTERLYQAGASGLIINISPYISEIPQDVLQMGDDLDFPIYEMPAEYHIIDISQSIGKAIVNAADEANRQERFLLDLIYNQYTFTEKKLNKVRELGYDLSRQHAVYSVQIDDEEEILSAIVENIGSRINQPENPVFCVAQRNKIILLATVDNGQLQKLADTIYAVAAETTDKEIKIGVSDTFYLLNNFIVCYEQSAKALLALAANEKKKICIYSELGLQRILYEVSNEEVLKDTVHKILGKIEQQDNAQEILLTLQAYLAESGNLNRTAERLYIHINTLRYRIEKIQHIMGVDLRNYSELFQIQLALFIREYMENSL